MVLSIWRFSHLCLAIASFSLLIVLSITGALLAFEPMLDEVNAATIPDNLTFVDFKEKLATNFDEVYSVRVNAYENITVEGTTKDGEFGKFAVKVGERLILNAPKSRKKIFEFATALHRSLFLKSTGRVLVGMVSFLLILIAVSGMVLLVKKQKKWYQFFTKYLNDGSYSYYHSYLGRWSLLSIIIIAISGVYISLEKFSLLPELYADKHQVVVNTNVLKTLVLKDIKAVDFPFSDDPEDYFAIETKQAQWVVNQFTGNLVEQKSNTFYGQLAIWSNTLHTGEGWVLWSPVLLLTCFAICYFIYSGFYIFLSRRKNKTTFKNYCSKDNAEVLIYVGSETGSTHNFAVNLANALKHTKKNVFLDVLNNYKTFDKTKCVFVLTATYGEGDAPANANLFLKKIKATSNNHLIDFSVLGFGSKAYKNYCSYADEVYAALDKKDKYKALLPVVKVNNQDFETYENWVKTIAEKLTLPIKVEVLAPLEKNTPLKVIAKSGINIDATFTLVLKPLKKSKIKSGDLLGVMAKENSTPRYYSIAKIGDQIHLSVKKHAFGECSTYLARLTPGATLDSAFVKPNQHFYFPKKISKVVLIANGTGVAPFLGMLYETKNKQQVDFYIGLRHKSSIDLYQPYLDTYRANSLNLQTHIALSSEKVYVQDLIANDILSIIDTLDSGGVLMFCGALKMRDSVVALLEKKLTTLGKSLSVYENNNQLVSDCY